jgi:hypothetical protein
MSRWPKRTLAERFWSHVNMGTSCWLWTGASTPAGYGAFGYRKGGREYTIGAHRMAWELTRGSIPKGKCICHHCDVGLCVNPSHLFVGTYLENEKDKMSKGRTCSGGRWEKAHAQSILYGEKHQNCKLSSRNVSIIRKAYSSGGIRQTDLALRFGVGKGYISAIVRMKKRVLG